jgi:hypothetical protein
MAAQRVTIKAQQSCQTLLARIEKLIDQVLFCAGISGQEVSKKHLRECGLFVEHADHGRLLDSHNDAFCQRRHRRQAPWLAGQTPLAEEISLLMKGNDRFLPAF